MLWLVGFAQLGPQAGKGEPEALRPLYDLRRQPASTAVLPGTASRPISGQGLQDRLRRPCRMGEHVFLDLRGAGALRVGDD